jgi:hypothetical protein
MQLVGLLFNIPKTLITFGLQIYMFNQLKVSAPTVSPPKTKIATALWA